jgi:phosphatidylserine/phosphatidylglycerophosphate/cardiolipin synthase-like enzyme
MEREGARVKKGLSVWLLHFFVLASALVGFGAHARLEVLFHPYQPTLEKIAAWLGEARARADIAMYSMDVSDRSPVIDILKSEPVRRRMENGELKIRLIYEGYDTPAENRVRMAALEELGIDVRYLGRAPKNHHKFAVVDANAGPGRVITGSANWSVTSYRNYDENILFSDGEAEMTYRYQVEFNRLWEVSREFGRAGGGPPNPAPAAADDPDYEVFFNSTRLLRLRPRDENAVLTEQVVRALEGAKHSVDVATTRIRLQPVLEAVAGAASRGVKLRILIGQEDYHDLWKRTQWLMASPNIAVRVKFYNMKVANFLTYQMHNKYMIVDGAAVFTGSFNWSKSGESNHIENLMEFHDGKAREILAGFRGDFERLWNLNRDHLDELKDAFVRARERGETPKCAFPPTSLEVAEIKQLFRVNANCQ